MAGDLVPEDCGTCICCGAAPPKFTAVGLGMPVTGTCAGAPIKFRAMSIARPPYLPIPIPTPSGTAAPAAANPAVAKPGFHEPSPAGVIVPSGGGGSPGSISCPGATGVTIEMLRNYTGEKVSLVRAMPNTAIAIQESMTCLCFDKINLDRLEYVQELFNQLGKVVVIDEKLMDAATVLGACGIAYALRYIRANIQGGIEIGFDAATASLIAAQTVKGAAELLIKTGRHPEQEIDKVTTPKGCTIAGLNEMEHQGFSSSLIKGISASFDKINHK